MGTCLSKPKSPVANTAEAAAARMFPKSFPCIYISCLNREIFSQVASDAGVAIEVPEFTLREIRKMAGDFSASNLIGKGAYAAVYKALLPNGRAAAAKRLRPPPTGNWDGSAVAILKEQVARRRRRS